MVEGQIRNCSKMIVSKFMPKSYQITDRALILGDERERNALISKIGCYYFSPQSSIYIDF